MMLTPYYEDAAAGITIYHGDCLDVMRQMDSGSIDLIFTSPPYNLGISSGGGIPRSRHANSKWSGAALGHGYDDHDDAMPYSQYVAWQKLVLRECWRLLSDTGAIFYNHKPRVQDLTLRTPLDLNPGLPVRQIIIWARAGGINFNDAFFLPMHEWIVVFAKPAFRLKNKPVSGIGDVWSIPQEDDNPHPAPFPLGLPARALEACKRGVVLDPFCGSGTTLRAAKDAGWRAIGIEQSRLYCQMTIERLQQSVLPLYESEAAS